MACQKVGGYSSVIYQSAYISEVAASRADWIKGVIGECRLVIGKVLPWPRQIRVNGFDPYDLV